MYSVSLWPARTPPGVTNIGRAINASAAPVVTVTAVKAKQKTIIFLYYFHKMTVHILYKYWGFE